MDDWLYKHMLISCDVSRHVECDESRLYKIVPHVKYDECDRIENLIQFSLIYSQGA